MKIYVENGEKIENFDEICNLVNELDKSVELYYKEDKKETIKLIYRKDYFIFKNDNFYFTNLHEKLNIIILFIQYRVIQLRNLTTDYTYDIFVNLGLLPIDSDITEIFYVDINPLDIVKLKTYEVIIFDDDLYNIIKKRNLLFKNQERYYILYFHSDEIRMSTDYISRENIFIYNYFNIEKLIVLNEYLLNSENKHSDLFRKLFLNEIVDLNILGEFNEFLNNLSEKNDFIFLMDMKKYLFDFKDFRNDLAEKLFKKLKTDKIFKRI